MTPRATDGDAKRRPGHIERAERDKAIAKAHLEGRRWKEICEEFGVSRRTAQRAARAFSSSVSMAPGEIEAVKREDVEALIALSIHAQGVALQRALDVLRSSPGDHAVTRAAHAAARLQAVIVDSMIKLGFVVPPEYAENVGELRALGEHMSRLLFDFKGKVAETCARLPEEQAELIVGWAEEVDRAFLDAVGSYGSGADGPRYPEISVGGGRRAA